jgi:lipopolysaccharide biosynthesis glycosyltransferase
LAKLNDPALRAKARTALRRGMSHVDALDRLAANRADQRSRTARLVQFYDRLRRRYTSLPPGDELPDQKQVAEVETAVLAEALPNDFLRVATHDADFDRAVVTVVRNLLDNKALPRARSLAQVIQQRPGLEPLGDICQALVTARDPMPPTAWALFCRNDVALAMRLAPVAYFRLGFAVDRDTALDTLRRALDEEFLVIAGPAGWLDIARASFAVGAEDLSAPALERAERGLARLPDRSRAENLRREIDSLRTWYGRAERARAEVSVPAGEIAFGVLRYARPDQRGAPAGTGDALNTLAALGNLVRRRGLEFTGDPHLVPLATALRDRVAPERMVDGGAATIRLVAVDRDASDYNAIPEGTWLIASGMFQHAIAGLRYDLPLNPRLRPIFIGFQINAVVLRTERAVEYLRRYAPIGCRDWDTVFLLQAAGIPAFFSGWLPMTVDTVARAGESTADGPLARSVFRALDRVLGYRAAPVVVSELRDYIAARAVGADVEFRPAQAEESKFEGLVDIANAEFARLRKGILDKLDAVLAAITAGGSEDEVRAVWRDVCAPDVARAVARRTEVGEIAAPSFDIAAACRQVHAESTVVERSQPGPDGSELNLEFSLDGNFKHQLDVVLDSIEARASRPIRAFVLCRGHGAADFERMATLFPTVSFVWLPMDHVDYGPIAGMIRHITVATMDRLLLPDLLPEVDRILHHDLDAVCLSDLAPLYDIELGDSPIAARDQMHPNDGSGFVSLTRSAHRLDAAAARELIVRTHTRHAFDFKIFNAGVMVLNLAQMRADDFCRQFLPYVERFGFNDQAVLNAYAGANRISLDAEWNTYPKFELIDGAKILHWLGPMKPWNDMYVQGRAQWRQAEAQFAERASKANLV